MDGRNIVANSFVTPMSEGFRGIDPSSGRELEGLFYPASRENVEEALTLAAEAFRDFSSLPQKQRALFLRQIASEITDLGDELTDRAVAESGLPRDRIVGETGRTVGQLQLFADLLEEGSWVNATIDKALPERNPPRPDIRKMLVPLGPVVVFGASNFPLAFSVAGGDTVSALAAGCPVVVKAHAAHPGTSALVGEAILRAAKITSMPAGTFSLLYDSGFTVGQQLVSHPLTKAVTFTGSFKGGMALIELARSRKEPIPVFAEMGSINPVVFLPEAMSKRAGELAVTYAASIALGCGQFCTNPGLLLAVEGPGFNQFVAEIKKAIEETVPATMLTSGICRTYSGLLGEVLQQPGVSLVARSTIEPLAQANQSVATLAKVSARDFMANEKLREEIFGPYSLLVVAENEQELKSVIGCLNGQLTVTLMAEASELKAYTPFIAELGRITGRLILNGVPTGVEVCQAMQHGGPFPATNDSRFTSVGTSAIYRFVRPLSWQGWPNELLPPELQDDNPLGILRKINNEWII